MKKTFILILLVILISFCVSCNKNTIISPSSDETNTEQTGNVDVSNENNKTSANEIILMVLKSMNSSSLNFTDLEVSVDFQTVISTPLLEA